MKSDELKYSDIRSIRIKSLIDAILELNQYSQLSPQTVTELEKLRKLRRYKKQILKDFIDDKI